MCLACCISVIFYNHSVASAVCKCGEKGKDGYICSSGYHTFSDHYLKLPSGRYGSRGCWISNEFTSNQKGKIVSSITAWNTALKNNDANGYVTLANITDSSAAQIKIKMAYMETGVQGITSFFSGTKELKIGDEGSTIGSNYTSTVIKVNGKTIDSVDIKGLVCHELGHSLGLSHRNCTLNSIMYKSDKRNYSVPQTKDINTIKHIYKYTVC